MNGPATRRRRLIGTLLLLVPLLVAAVLLGVTIRHRELNEPFFAYSIYYVLFAVLLIYTGVRLSGLEPSASLRVWVKDNFPGIAVTAAVSTVVLLAVPPAFRVLADEANLVGVSKNLYFDKTANFAVTGKWYFENYWDLNTVTARRPALYPFLVSLLHVVRGYDPKNAFYLNAITFVLFVFFCYRLAKALDGEVYGIVTAILVGVTPNTLLVARSGAFDLLATFLLLLTIKSFLDYSGDASPRRLAVLVLHLCLLAHVRYEGVALLVVGVAALAAMRLLKWKHLRGFGWLYALVPLLLLPRYWQALAKADDSEQPLSISLFSFFNFWRNTSEYLKPVLRPLQFDSPRAPLLIILAGLGCAVLLGYLFRSLRAKKLAPAAARFAVFVTLLLGTEALIIFFYRWGKPEHPASARLFIWLDTFVAFGAAWLLTVLGRRFAVPVAMLGRWSGAPIALPASVMLFGMHLPAASEARFSNTLVLTREAAATWRFFDSLGEKRILILADRPGLYTIMDYGAQDITTANANRTLLFELSRQLYRDIYLIQEVDLKTHRPQPRYDPWPDVKKETVLEFQNSATSSTRIARVKH